MRYRAQRGGAIEGSCIREWQTVTIFAKPCRRACGLVRARQLRTATVVMRRMMPPRIGVGNAEIPRLAVGTALAPSIPGIHGVVP